MEGVKKIDPEKEGARIIKVPPEILSGKDSKKDEEGVFNIKRDGARGIKVPPEIFSGNPEKGQK